MIKPIKNKVIVKPYPSDEFSEGGIIVSEAHREVSNKMRVVAVGNGTKITPMQFKEGDTVFRVKGVGEEIEIEGELHFCVEQSWLIAKLN